MHKIAIPLLACFGLLLGGCQTISPEQQHATDQNRCAGYGYQPGTDKFADCMRHVDNRREDQAAAQSQRDDYLRSMSIKRNGNPKFPVCSASMMDATLDTVNNAWYGPDCRER